MIDFSEEESRQIKRKNWIDSLIFQCVEKLNEEQMKDFLTGMLDRINQEIDNHQKRLYQLYNLKRLVIEGVGKSE